MRSQTASVGCFRSMALAVLFCSGIASVAQAAGPAFDQGTVAQKYTFSAQGQEPDGDTCAVVGWITIDGLGFAVGKIHGAVTAGGGVAYPFSAVSTGPFENGVALVDGVNGDYSVHLTFADTPPEGGSITHMTLAGNLILDDVHGRTGRLSAVLTCAYVGSVQVPAVAELISQ